MSTEAKRYSVVLHVANDSPFRQTGDSCTRPIRTDVVLATDYAALESECERLRQFEIAYNDWQAKTDWVQESAKSHELGRHRADVLRARIDALAAELAAIKGQEHAAEQPDTVGAPRKLLAEAERIIDSYAEALKECHAPGGDWTGEEAAQDDYEHEAGVASELRAILAIAQIQERNT